MTTATVGNIDTAQLYMSVYANIHMHMYVHASMQCVCMCIYIYIYICMRACFSYRGKSVLGVGARCLALGHLALPSVFVGHCCF